METKNQKQENQLNNIIPLQKIVSVVDETISERFKNLEAKLDRLNNSIENVDSPFTELKALKEQIQVFKQENDTLTFKNKEYQEHISYLETQLNQLIESDELRRTKEAYRSLVVFCFQNINPMTDFDPAHAKYYWENLVK